MWHSLQYKKSGNCCPLGTEQHITFKSFQQAQQPTGDCDDSWFVGCSSLVFGEMFPNFRRPIYLPSNDRGPLTPGVLVIFQNTLIWTCHNSLRRGLSQITSHISAGSRAQNIERQIGLIFQPELWLFTAGRFWPFSYSPDHSLSGFNLFGLLEKKPVSSAAFPFGVINT
jgi:hypothetical protein